MMENNGVRQTGDGGYESISEHADQIVDCFEGKAKREVLEGFTVRSNAKAESQNS